MNQDSINDAMRVSKVFKMSTLRPYLSLREVHAPAVIMSAGRRWMLDAETCFSTKRVDDQKHKGKKTY